MYHYYNIKVHKYRHRALRFNLFAAIVLFPRCFFLSTDTDVGGSKQKRVLLSKTCYQTCTRMYRFDNRSKNRTCITRAAKRISASIAVRNTTVPISVCFPHTAVTRSVRKRVFFNHFIVCLLAPNSFQNLSNTVLQYPFLYLFKSF